MPTTPVHNVARLGPEHRNQRAARSLEDVQIVQAVQQGDTRVAGQLYVQLRPVIDRTLYRVLGKREQDHEDFVQVAFEQILKSMTSRQFGLYCSLATWSSMIAARVGLAELRRRYRYRRVFSSATNPEDNHPEVDMQRRLEARSDLKQVRVALSKLRDSRALPLVLHDVEGHSMSEICALLGSSSSAVHSRLVRARRQLRGELSKSGVKGQRRG